MFAKNAHNRTFNGSDKLTHELKGSLGMVKMLLNELVKELTPSEYAIRLIEIIISILERNLDLQGEIFLERNCIDHDRCRNS